MFDEFYKIAQRSLASQDRKELECLLRAVSHIDINVVLEIGVHRGHSLLTWEEAFHPHILIGVDHANHIEPPHLKENLILGDSTAWHIVEAVAEASKLTDVDFLFIDGNHLDKPVRKDWENYSKMVREGGVVVFHDVCIRDNPTVEVYKLWGELKRIHCYQEIHKPGGAGTGVGIIYV